MQWVSLAIAPDQLTAEMWCELLRNEGIAAMVQPSDAVSFLGVSAKACRVVVPEDRREEAAAVLRKEMGDTLTIEPP
ncbi:MAG: DUF2007 domain-containing protein [Dehalococcoidia bacterium]|nr:DUF2007 domain-containing protein [Dehalococcoidia bacterium]